MDCNVVQCSLLETAHALVSSKTLPGDAAVDATVGNGHDTLFLAQCVGLKGEVIGFDVQQQALDNAKHRPISLDEPSANKTSINSLLLS